jgi:arylsulfatase A
LLAKLDELKLRDNTLVIFTTDNGGIQHQFDPAPFLSGERTPTHLTIREHTFDNAPLRYGKGSLYEGGIRVPLIARWPGVIKPKSINRIPVQIADWLPTFFAIAGAKAPPTHKLDGVSLRPLLRSSGSLKPRALFWYAPLYDIRWAATPAAVIREGDWKLIEFYGDYISPDDGKYEYVVGHRVELYNLRADLGEKNNLATLEPQRAKRMLARLHVWHKTVGAEMPRLNPHYDPARALREVKEKPKIKP